ESGATAMTVRCARARVLLGGFLCLVGISFAQTGTSSGRRTVTDPQGRVVPSAFVTLTSTGTGIVRTQKSGPVGNFSFDLVPPGDYRLEIEAPGFQKSLLENVHALVATP